jgi:hypothetical protein
VRQAIASQPDFGHPDALLEAPGRRRLQPNRTRRESARSGKSRALCRARMQSSHARTQMPRQAGAHAHASLHFCVLTQRARWRVARTHPNTATARTAAQRQRAHRDAHALRSARDRWSVLL